MLGEFVLDLSAATYAGVALLLLASALSAIRGREASASALNAYRIQTQNRPAAPRQAGNAWATTAFKA